MENNNFNDFNQQNMYNNTYPYQPPIPPEKKYKWLKTTSLVLGILSLLSCLLIFINIPLGFLGLIFAIIYACCAKKICSGLWINIVSMILSVVLFFAMFIGLSFITINEVNNANTQLENGATVEEVVEDSTILKLFTDTVYSFIENIEDENSQIRGTWELIDYNDAIIDGKEKIVTCMINPDGTFLWGKYGEEDINYVEGTYKVTSLSIDNGDWKYNITLTGDKYYVNGVLQDEPYISDYEVVIIETDFGKEAVFYNLDTTNMYYGLK